MKPGKPVTCTVVWCTEPPWGRGLCAKHYRRYKRNGDPVTVDEHAAFLQGIRQGRRATEGGEHPW